MNTINNCPQVLTDQDKIEDLLSEEKYLISGYGTFIPEASCPQLRQVLTQNFTECVQNQYTIIARKAQRRLCANWHGQVFANWLFTPVQFVL